MYWALSIATCAPRRGRPAPIIAGYPEETGGFPADPYGAAATGPVRNSAGTSSSPDPTTEMPGSTGCLGRNGVRCSLTATGPTPGPPPPCGMQKVLCRFRCDTSAPNEPGCASPTSAFRLAPSMYTWPPAACTRSQTSLTVGSNTPLVDG